MSTYADRLVDRVVEVLNAEMQSSPRSQQSAANIIGVSDIGGCREQVRHMIVGSPRDEEQGNRFPAMWGIAIEDYVVPRLAGPVVSETTVNGHSAKVTEKGIILGLKVETTLPSGKVVKGTPDYVAPAQNLLLDVKTTNGLTYVRREGASLQQRFQRRLYTAGLVQAGVFTGDEVRCGNLWFDRSGVDPRPHVEVEAFDMAMLVEIDDWLSDVDYAVLNGEEAQRDKPFEWCEKACAFFSLCRGADGVVGEGGWIDDPDGSINRYALGYVEGAALIKEGKRLQEEAKPHLLAVSGRTEDCSVLSTYVAPTDVPGYTRAGYDRMTVRKVTK